MECSASHRPIPKILCVCRGDEERTDLVAALATSFDVDFAGGLVDTEERFAVETPDAVLILPLATPEEVFETLTLIASQARRACAVVIDRTGSRKRIEALLDAGANTCLVEPLSPGQLFATLAAALRSKTVEQSATRGLAAYRERIEGMLDQAPVPIFVKDADGRYRFTNRAFHRYVGMSKEQVIGRRDRELVDRRQAAELEASDRMVLAGEGTYEGERDLHLTGEHRVYCSTKFPFRDADGNIVGVVGMATDITEQRMNEAVRNAAAREQRRLIDQLRSARTETVDRLTLALLKRDVVSGEHVSRMAVVASWLGALYGLDPHRVMLMRSAAPMHDVGKIAIRDEILQKPGPLTMEERAEMERHPRIGFEILDDSSSEVLNLGAIIALTHHENWDGSGYPRGLRGIEIPIEGRVCAVADVFDALLSDRPYRPAMSLDEARAIMLDGRGRFFDPDVVDLLLDHFEEAGALRDASAAGVTSKSP